MKVSLEKAVVWDMDSRVTIFSESILEEGNIIGDR
jgi:hypothetical protein